MNVTKIEKDDFPFLLKQTPSLPRSMDLIGSIPSGDFKFVSVVGSRKHSKYGEYACRKLITGLRGYPIAIVSGMAIGIDSIAHESALEAGLPSIAFPGSGLSPSVLYPPSKRDLAKRIVEAGGALLSPFEYEQQATGWTFPKRNLLMAGISHATLIIEAARKSGTLITAQNALDFGRDVLVVPGSIFSDLSYGSQYLLRNGATPIASSADILEALGFRIYRGDGMDNALPNFAERALTEHQLKIVNYLRVENLDSSDLIDKTKLSSSEFNQVISELEIMGIVSITNGSYRLV